MQKLSGQTQTVAFIKKHRLVCENLPNVIAIIVGEKSASAVQHVGFNKDQRAKLDENLNAILRPEAFRILALSDQFANAFNNRRAIFTIGDAKPGIR